MTTFVLVHGAWHGGWCWSRVRRLLEAEGHWVLTPTLTGLGERAHLLGRHVGLGTHIDDVCAVLRYESVRECVLVGHSYAGIVIAGVLDRLQRRRAAADTTVLHAVYLDSVIVQPGECWADTQTPEQRRVRLDGLQTGTDGVAVIAPPTPAQVGVRDSADAAWLDALMTPHPAATYLEPLNAPCAYDNGVPRTYIDCNAPSLPALAGSKRVVRDSAGWRVEALPMAHDCMVTEPARTARALLEVDVTAAG